MNIIYWTLCTNNWIEIYVKFTENQIETDPSYVNKSDSLVNNDNLSHTVNGDRSTESDNNTFVASDHNKGESTEPSGRLNNSLEPESKTDNSSTPQLLNNLQEGLICFK